MKGVIAVHEFVTQWRRAQKQVLSAAFIPLAFEPWEAFQFD